MEKEGGGKSRGESPALLQGSQGQVRDVLALSLVRSQRGLVKLITASLGHRCESATSVAALEEKYELLLA